AAADADLRARAAGAVPPPWSAGRADHRRVEPTLRQAPPGRSVVLAPRGWTVHRTHYRSAASRAPALPVFRQTPVVSDDREECWDPSRTRPVHPLHKYRPAVLGRARAFPRLRAVTTGLHVS